MNRNLTTLAKVTRPTLPDVFPRKRLFDLLDDLRDRPFVWVSGPPGCVKTTLISSYIETLKAPCLWYNLDQGDSDPATFFYYMGLAAKKAAPRMRKSLPLLTPEYLSGISTFTRVILKIFAIGLKSRVSLFLTTIRSYRRKPPALRVVGDSQKINFFNFSRICDQFVIPQA